MSIANVPSVGNQNNQRINGKRQTHKSRANAIRSCTEKALTLRSLIMKTINWAIVSAMANK